MAWTPPSDAVETQASSGTAVTTGWTPPSDAVETGAAPATGWTPPADAVEAQVAPATATEPDTYDYTLLGENRKYQSAPSKDGKAMVSKWNRGEVTPTISNTFIDQKGSIVVRGKKTSDEEWIAERRAKEAEPASTFAQPGDVVVPRRTEFTPPATAVKATPVKATPPMDMEARLAAQEAKRAEFSPLEEAKKGVVGAATVGIPSSVEQFKLAGGAEVLQNTIQQMQLLDKIDKGQVTSPRDLPNDPRVRMYYASNPEVRNQLRQSINKDLVNNKAFVTASMALLDQYQKEGQKYKGRQEKVLESESAADFGNWLAKNVGAGAVYAVPSILAAVVGKQPGLFAFSTGMGYTEAVGNRLEAMDKELQQLPVEQRAARVAKRLQETDDVNLAVAIASGALDAVLGPAASVAKQTAKESIKAMSRKEAAKELIKKEIPKQGAEEFVAGSLQEGAQAAGKVKTGEREKFATKETAKEMFESGAGEMAGSLGTTAGIGAYRIARTPSTAKTVEEKEETTKVEPTFDADKELEKAPVQPETAAKQKAATTNVTPPVQPAPTPELTELVEKYKKRGFMAEDALSLAQNELEDAKAAKVKATGVPDVTKWTDAALTSTLKLQQAKPDTAPAMTTAETPVEQRSAKNKPLIEAIEAEIATREKNKGAENVAESVSEAGGESAEVSTQSADNVPPATGLGDTKRDGVVSTRQDVSESAEGKGTKPTAVKDADVTDTVTYFEKRDELTKQLDAASEESSALLDKLLDLDSVRAADVLGDDGKPLVLDENGNYDSDKKYEAVKALEAKRKEASAKFDAILKQLDELDASRKSAKETKPAAVTAEGAPKDRLVTSYNGKPWTYFYPGAEVVQSNFAGAPAKVVGVEEKRGQPTLYKLEVDVSKHPDGVDDNGDRVNTKTVTITDEELNRLNPPTETKGADVGTETSETVQTKEKGQETSTAGAVTGKPRGRPKADITEEERAEKEKARTEGRAEYMKGERALPKLQAQLDEANAPIDESKIDDDEGLKNAEEEKRALKRDTINAMMDLEAKHRGTALGKRIKAALADRSKISQKEFDDITAGRKYKAQERVNKSTASNEEVEDADEGFKKATNAAQAINHIIKTGTGFQKFLAKRLRGLVNGVKFVVVEETDPLPEQLSRHQDAWGNDNSRARGVYFENTATGERIIFVRGASAGGFQGINNTTVLHELLHAATQKKLEMALLAVQRGFSGDAKLVRAYNDLIAVMNNARDEYNRLANLGQLPTDIYYLKTVSGVFSNPHEFVSYGMTDPYFQKFLMGAYGFEEETGLFNRFVDAIRELLGLGIDSVNALSDLIVVTDKILNAKLTPTMQMIAKADKANAVREGRAGKVAAAKANSKKVSMAEKKIMRSKEAQGVTDGIGLLTTLRDPQIFLDVVASMWHGLNVTKLKALLPALQTNILVEWGASLGITHMDTTWRSMQDMGAMRMKMLGGASEVVNKWLNVQPGMYGKLIKGKKNELNELSAVMHYATDKNIDPATNKKDATLNKMWDGLSDTAKEIYVEVRDFYKSNFDLYRLLLDKRIDAMNIPGTAADPDTPKGKLMAEIKQMYETAKGLSPYFPLMRYGDYWLRVGSGKKKEFYMFESVAHRELFMRQRVRDLQKEGDTRSLEKMKSDQDIETGNDLKALRDKSATNDTAPLLKQIFELIGDGVSELEAETLKDQIYQLYLTTMPEQSFRRQFIHRKGTAGFSGDALRNFITSSTNMANQLARLKYGQQMIREVDAAKESLKGNPEKDKLEMLVNELGERVQLEVYPPAVDSTARGVANVANKSAFLYFMTSVKTAVIQFSSLPIFGAPVLMSRHSTPAVLAEMGKMMLVFNDVGIMDKDGKFSMPSLINSRRVKLSADDQLAAEAMIDRGVSEITMAYDLMDRRKTPSASYSGAWNSATNMMGALFHHVERLNREVMFMTSFRLSRKAGMSVEDAIDQAVKDTYDSLGNFSEQNRSRYARSSAGRVLLQFKTYPAFVTTYLTRNAYRMFAGMDAKAKKEAATQFFGTIGMSGLLAGYVGIPGMSAAMGAVQGIINAMRDDDDEDPLEKRDIEFWLRSVFIPNFFGEAQIGGHKISEIIDSGLIDTITGYAMSNSLSMNNMWMPELKEQRNLEDTMQEYALSLMGPSASLLLNQIPSGLRLLQEGKTMQGLERLLPAFLRQPLTAVRYSKEGATTSDNKTIKPADEFTKAQLIAQAAGARTTGLASVQEANFKANALIAKATVEKGKLINRLDLEAMRGSDEEFDKALEKLISFGARNPKLRVDGEDLSKISLARMQKREKADRGFDVDEKFYPYLEELLAPSREKIEKEAAK